MKIKKVISTAISLALGISLMVPAYATESKFTDVSADAYYTKSVSWAVEKGITSGTSATTFSPDATCTTAQILTFLWRANGSSTSDTENPFTDLSGNEFYYNAAIWGYDNGLVSGTQFNGDTPCTRSATMTYLWKLAGEPSAGSSNFTDVSPNAEYANAVSWGVSKNITAGTSDTTFSPDLTCTRGQIVTFLWRAENPDSQSQGQQNQNTSQSETPSLTEQSTTMRIPSLGDGKGKNYSQLTEEEKAQIISQGGQAKLNALKNNSCLSINQYGNLTVYDPHLVIGE